MKYINKSQDIFYISNLILGGLDYLYQNIISNNNISIDDDISFATLDIDDTFIQISPKDLIKKSTVNNNLYYVNVKDSQSIYDIVLLHNDLDDLYKILLLNNIGINDDITNKKITVDKQYIKNRNLYINNIKKNVVYVTGIGLMGNFIIQENNDYIYCEDGSYIEME